MDPFGSVNSQLDDLLRRICVKLQLSESQRKMAEQRYLSVAKWLSDGTGILAAANPQIYPQGSLRNGTTVKPIGKNEFDLDLVCELQLDATNYPPAAIMDAVEKRLKEHDTYKKLIKRRKNRCIRLEYANEFHLDIVPACPNGVKNNGAIKIPDRELNAWLDSNPKGYAEWFERAANQYFSLIKERKIEPLPPEENGSSKSPLKYALQLVKRNRDLVFYQKKDTLLPKSIVLTTLGGHLYRGNVSIAESMDVVLNGIIGELAVLNGRRLVVVNPAAPEEDLTDHWDAQKDAYDEFIAWVRKFHISWHLLRKGQGFQELVPALRVLFGESLTQEVMKEQVEEMNKAREAGLLKVASALGTISLGNKSAGIPVARNTFFGDQ